MANLTNILNSDSCAVADALDRLGLTGVAPRIHRLTTTNKLVGPVRTVVLAPASAGKTTNHHLATSSLESARKGDVFVISNGARTDAAAWGGLLGRAGLRSGVAGVIIDGACRDIDELNELEFPVFARSATPCSARGRFVEVARDVDTTIGDIPVRSDDWVVADGSGVVFIPQDRLDEVEAAVAEILLAERKIKKSIQQGRPLTNVFDQQYETLTTANNA